MAEPPQLKWSAQFTITPNPRGKQLPGDKILLPPSALEQLLSASAAAAAESTRRDLPAYDPYNSATYSAYRQAESQYEDQRHQLPYPLTFRLVNPESGRVVYAGIREFSAEEDEAVLSPFLLESLGVKHAEEKDGGVGEEYGAADGNGVASPKITVHVAQLPKGTFVKLRPLEPGYDPEDWKALLEQHLRQNYTTLTNGEMLAVQGGMGIGGKKEEFRFLVDGFKPEVDGICVVDTDLEVDIEALNEEQARETMKRIAAKIARAPGTGEGSSAGGELDLYKSQQGQILSGEYVDYELPSWNKALPIEIELSGEDDDDEVDLLISPHSARQQARPRLDEHVFADFSGRPRKRIRLEPTNIELEDVEALYVSVHAFTTARADSSADAAQPGPLRHYTIRAHHPPDHDVDMKDSSTAVEEVPPNSDDVRCKNCAQWVPKQTLMLHENFCLRNNLLCPQGCGQVFQKRSPELASHWHCPHDPTFGNTTLSQTKHNTIHHPHEVLRCPQCSTTETFPNTSALARHRTSTCPAKLILCRFCHLLVPQEGDPDIPNPEALLSGMTPHELADGARTTECHLCARIIRLRDMSNHLKSHDLDRLDRLRPQPCRNVYCGRTVDACAKNGDTRAGTRMGQGSGNDMGLCSVCYGPLYVSMHDPEAKAMRRRVERRYLQQLVAGCGKGWCRNEFCKSGRKHVEIEPAGLGMKDAVPLVRPFVEGLGKGGESPLHFCVDERSQRSRQLAGLLAAEDGRPGGKGGYGFEWCVGALEAEAGDLDGARRWLGNWAPKRGEERRW